MMAKKVGSHCKTHVGMDPPTQSTMKGLHPHRFKVDSSLYKLTSLIRAV